MAASEKNYSRPRHRRDENSSGVGIAARRDSLAGEAIGDTAALCAALDQGKLLERKN
jgi:hypothetical protein